MKVLITGGAGFIGSHLAAALQGRATVRVLDNLRSGHRRNLAGLSVEWMEGSILDRAAVARAVAGVDYVFHLAALVSVPESVARPHDCVEINVTGLLHVLEASAAAGVRKLCFSSSAAVYGNNPVVPKREDMVPEPRSPYAVTKLDGEYYCHQYTESGRLETAALRFFNVFGPRQDPAGAYAAAIPLFMERALAGRPLLIFGDGGQTRDFVYVEDVVGALLFAATTPGLTGVYNVGYGGQITVLEVAQRILALAGSASPIQYLAERPGDVRHSRADVAKLQQAGFRPRGTLEQGLAATLASLRSPASSP
ncbi:MAG: NAD-dependent epimerase/dehydratase family protein [Opitutaceae bacterium]|nr:NAD-dependent epimerase/dehydratase family protein [Opitutaceae bacterium]